MCGDVCVMVDCDVRCVWSVIGVFVVGNWGLNMLMCV